MIDNNQNTKITYLYDANGNKLSKNIRKVATGNGITTDYLDGFQYRNATLLFFPTTEGYVNNTVVATVNNYNYIFNYKDHLGNIRLSYSKDPTTQVLKILEENHYYPFGLKHTNYNTTVLKLRGGAVVAGLPKYNYKYQGQERQDELGLNWDSFKWQNYDPAYGRFMSIDPLAPDFPQWSSYVFSGNLVLISKELEGKEPEFLIGADGKLTSGVITLMQSAYGYSTSSLGNTTWIVNSDPRASTLWNKVTGYPEASTKGNEVIYNSNVVNGTDNYWFGLISHEQSHRNDIDKGISSGDRKGYTKFYLKYIFEGIFGKYEDIGTEKTAYKIGSDNNKVDYADKLLSYKGGAVMDIFQRGGLTNNEKASMLEEVGSQFKRDVVLQDSINGANTSLSNLNGLNLDAKTKADLTKTLNGLINQWTNEQNNITKKYGK